MGGHFTHTKLQAASRHFILAQNMCIGASAISATMLLLNHLTPHNQPEVYWSLMAVMILLGALSSIGSTGVRIAVENKAVQRLCGNNSTALSSVNSVFRAIDLTALLAAPLPVGALMTWVGPLAATLMLATFCMLAWVPELVLLRMAFNASEVLRWGKCAQKADMATTHLSGWGCGMLIAHTRMTKPDAGGHACAMVVCALRLLILLPSLGIPLDQLC